MLQEQLADLLELSRQAVSRWERENGLPETGIVVRLSDIFGVTIDYPLKENEKEKDCIQTPCAAAAPKRHTNLIAGICFTSFSVIAVAVVFFIPLSDPSLKNGTYGMLDWNFWVYNDITGLAGMVLLALAAGIYHLGKYYFQDCDPPMQ